jgi:choline dehydrogenase
MHWPPGSFSTDGRASGVEYHDGRGQTVRATALREVIVAGGAIESPKLLQLSGVGPGDHLQALGIDVVHDNPSVGDNLQEHAAITLTFGVTVSTLNQQLTPAGIIRHGFDFVVHGRGAATSPPTHVFLFAPGIDDPNRSDYELFFAPFGLTVAPNQRGPERVLGARAMEKGPIVSIGVEACHPDTTGTVRLRSRNATDLPLITHQLLSDKVIADLTRGAREVRRIVDEPAFRQFVDRELTPGPTVETDADWAQQIRSSARGGHHPIGTCKMGTDPSAVVDPDLKVIGVDGLRVADCSVMPSLISGHTNAAAVMIGERVADLIRTGSTLLGSGVNPDR